MRNYFYSNYRKWNFSQSRWIAELSARIKNKLNSTDIEYLPDIRCIPMLAERSEKWWTISVWRDLEVLLYLSRNLLWHVRILLLERIGIIGDIIQEGWDRYTRLSCYRCAIFIPLMRPAWKRVFAKDKVNITKIVDR